MEVSRVSFGRGGGVKLAGAYNGRQSTWYEAAVRQTTGLIMAAGMTKEVTFDPVDGRVNDRIDDACRTKYRGSRYRASMIRAEARAATMKVTPRELKP